MRLPSALLEAVKEKSQGRGPALSTFHPGNFGKGRCGEIGGTQSPMATPTASSALAPSPLKGIFLVLLAVLIFASMDTAGKFLMTKFNVPMVAAVRYGLNLVFLVILMAPRHGPGLWKTRRTALVVFRGVSLAAATLFAGLALQRMPVGETVAIIYLQGFGVMLAAGYFLGERVSLAGWIAAVVGFAGVLLIARPDGALAPVGVGFVDR